MPNKTHRNRTLEFNARKHVPLPTGQYRVIGIHDVMVGFSKKGGVLLRLYYPAAEQSRDITDHHLLWPNWFPHENYWRGMADARNIRWGPLFGFLKWNMGDSFIPAIPNAKPLRRDEPFPVIVFSHGLAACRSTYSGVCLEMASHGFVVAAVEHRDNSACLSIYAKHVRMSMKDSNPNFFFDGTDATDGDGTDEADFGDEIDDPNYVPPKALSAVTSIPHITMEWVRHRYVPYAQTGKKIYTFRNKQIHHRVRECTRALDVFEALHAGYELNNILDPLFDHSAFEGLLDLDKAIVMGHSFGGATAVMSAASELRFKVAVCLDPWMYPIKDEFFELVSQPILCVNTEAFQSEPNLKKLSELLKPNPRDRDDPTEFEERRKAVTINGSVHYNQTDLPFISNWFIKLVFGLSGKRSRFTAHDLTTSLVLTFLAKHLNIPIDEEIEKYVNEKKKKFRPSIKEPKSKK